MLARNYFRELKGEAFDPEEDVPWSTEKPASGAWMPDATIDYLFDKIADGKFYIICPGTRAPYPFGPHSSPHPLLQLDRIQSTTKSTTEPRSVSSEAWRTASKSDSAFELSWRR